jgi:class 3 adenylate cyclase
VVLHHGEVFMGGVASLGEENLSGKEVNFVFRMEKLASALGVSRLLSEAAHGQLAGRLQAKDVGTHILSGFEGQYRFFSF